MVKKLSNGSVNINVFYDLQIRGVLIENNKTKTVYSVFYYSILNERVMDTVYDILGDSNLFVSYLRYLSEISNIGVYIDDKTLSVYHTGYKQPIIIGIYNL